MTSPELVHVVAATFSFLVGLKYIQCSPVVHTPSTIKPKLHEDLIVGETDRLKCWLPSRNARTRWTKDGNLLNVNESTHLQIKRRHVKNRGEFEILRISPLKIGDSGLYVCSLKENKQIWKLSVTTVANYGPVDDEPVCGQPLDVLVSTRCAIPSYPNCTSFPGIPLNVKAVAFIYNEQAVIQIGWSRPSLGKNDLWGYQAYIVGLKGDANHQMCYQINSKLKKKLTYMNFLGLKFGALYSVVVQSMPANNRKIETNMKELLVPVKEQCEYKEFRYRAICCSINATARLVRKQIQVSWGVTCLNSTVSRYRVSWVNIQNPRGCSGSRIVRDPWTNLSIPLLGDCYQHNYTIRVNGIADNNETTRRDRVTLHIPQEPVVFPVVSTKNPVDSIVDLKVMVAVIGVVLGLAMCGLFFIYKRYFIKVVIKLPQPPQTAVATQTAEPLITESERLNRLFIMHARCCEKCDWVVHCLGVLLNSTGLVEVRTDVWFEREIATGVLRWYEDEIRQASCVVVLASDKMRERNQNILSDRDSEDPLRITMQLNLIRGEIGRDPATAKFVPAYFKYSGEAKVVPDFLTSRLTHVLPKDLYRLVYHVLDIERIQPYRTQPIAVLGGAGHPFEACKLELQNAIDKAAVEHNRCVDSNNLNPEQADNTHV